MKKNFIKTALVAVFCFAAGYTAYNAQNRNENLSELALANMEALARYELPEVGITCNGSSGTCWATAGDCSLDYMGWIRAQDCTFSGDSNDSCTTPC